MNAPYHNVSLASVWAHEPAVAVSMRAWSDPLADETLASRMRGRAVMTFSASGFELSQRPTAADLRALAAAALATAADIDEATATKLVPLPLPLPLPNPPSRRHEAPRAVWPAGLTHLQGVRA